MKNGEYTNFNPDLEVTDNTGEVNRVKRKALDYDHTQALIEIDKMDSLLLLKTAEKEKAKLSRIQVERESLNVVNKLINSGISKAIEINLKALEKLIYESENKSSDYKDCRMTNNEISEKDKKCEISSPRLTKNNDYVKKNIQLAKCGMGVLSITDEEKERLIHLLQSDDSNDKDKEGTMREEYYFKSRMTDFHKLTQIDEQLEAFKKSPSSFPSRTEITNYDENERQNERAGRLEKQHKIREKYNVKSRLKEIEKSLDTLKCSSDENIKPLSDEDMDFLIKNAEKGFEGMLDWTSAELRPSKETLMRLVSSAKSAMPKFDYRYDET